MEQQLVTSAEDEHFIAVFYGGGADENVSPQESEVVASYFSPISETKGVQRLHRNFLLCVLAPVDDSGFLINHRWQGAA